MRIGKARIFWSALLIAWIAFIFANSLQVAEASAGHSGRALAIADALLGALGIAWRPTEHLIRKLAHFAEYAALGSLALAAMRRYAREPKRYILLAALVCVLVPVADESIQYFVPGRSGQISDVLLDCAGAFTGGFAAEAFRRILRR